MRIQEIADTGAGDDALAKVLQVINEDPPALDEDVERCHPLGRQSDPARTVRFN